MNKKTLFIGLLIMAFALAACGGTQAQPTNTTAGEPGNFPMPQSSQLLIGTLKLDGTAQQVTLEQAATLLPLWKLMKTLSESDTTASQETDALIKQINNAMTSEQLDAIAAMNLTPQDTFALMQELGIETAFQGNGRGTGTGSSGSDRPDNFQPPEGFVPGQGGGPGGGMGPGGGTGTGQTNMTQEQIATAQAQRSERMNSAASLPSELLDALISYLEGIAQ